MAIRGWSIGLIGEALILVLSVLDRRTPWYAKALAAVALALPFSPVGLLLDLVPIVGWIDEAAIVAICLWLAGRFIPSEVTDDVRARFRRKKRGLAAR